MNLSYHNIQSIIEWIKLEVDYNCFNFSYTIAINDDQVLYEKSE